MYYPRKQVYQETNGAHSVLCMCKFTKVAMMELVKNRTGKGEIDVFVLKNIGLVEKKQKREWLENYYFVLSTRTFFYT